MDMFLQKPFSNNTVDPVSESYMPTRALTRREGGKQASF
jgi:hypothetical protein